MKILVISMAGIGDTLIATPLIHELRANFPEAVIDALVVWPGAQDLLKGNPWLNTVHQRNLMQEGSLAAIRYFLGFRKERYDVSINVHPQSKIHYRIAARIIGAKLRLSHWYDNSTWVDRLFVNRVAPQNYALHSIDMNLELLGLLGKQPLLKEHTFELFFTPEETAQADKLAAEANPEGRRVIGVHVGSGTTKNLIFKRWPVEHWIKLIQQITGDRRDVTVMLFGGPEERAENERILREAASERLAAPKTPSLRVAASLMRHCEAFISVDNALMHIAAAMKVPRQIVIESPAWGPTLAPYRRPFVLVENPAVHGRNLEYYRYDGAGIRGTAEDLRRAMEAVSVDAAFAVLAGVLDRKTA
jgi:ADP-heptose:LPS heptosyltransferase